MKKARERGDNPDGLQEIYARIINYAIADRPADMMITTHVCRGNFRSTWISSGGYEPVAETMLPAPITTAISSNTIPSAPAGSSRCAICRRATSRGGRRHHLEIRGSWKEGRHQAADGGGAKFAPLDQLAVSPQCGFASTEEGNLLAEEEQWAN